MSEESEPVTVTAEERRSVRRVRWDEATRHLLEDWHLRVTTAQFGHLARAEQTRKWSIGLGIPVVVLTTLVGTSAFATLNKATSDEAKFIVGLISIAAAVLASTQTFLGYSQFSERHRIAATRYANTRRTIEVALTRHDASAVDVIRGEMDKVGGASPQIGTKVWEASTIVAKRALEEWRAEQVVDLEGRSRATPQRSPRKVAPRT
jgi:hypothetical protein